jgi:cephalosporin-C deacetylase
VLIDLPLAELETYRPDVAEPSDFDGFWAEQLTAARTHDREVSFQPVASGLTTVEVEDVRFPGHGGTPVGGWLLRPAGDPGPLPAIVEFAGYGGGRGLPHERLVWSAAGYVHLIMDTRGQGSHGSEGITADTGDAGEPAAAGWLTRGVLDPRTAYLTRLYVDAARAVDAVRSHPAVDAQRVGVAGISQGGGLALAAAHLAGDPAVVLAAVPFLAHIRRAVDLTDEDPYAELQEYCRHHPDHVEAVFASLAYHDVVNHARRATAPTLISVGLADAVCPPSTGFAAANHHGGDVRVQVYPFDGHDGGGPHRVREELAFAAKHLGRAPAAATT